MSPARRRERGYSLVALMASVTIALILMTAAVPTWRYVMKDAREEELIFRGNQIAEAIERYQKKNGNALPPSLEVLVKSKFLRKLYTDPMVEDGKWRLLGAGAPVPPGLGPSPGPSPSPSPSAAPPGSGVGGVLGPVAGVASRGTEKALRLYNGRLTKYSEWLFLAGQKRVFGRQEQKIPGQPSPGPSRKP